MIFILRRSKFYTGEWRDLYASDTEAKLWEKLEKEYGPLSKTEDGYTASDGYIYDVISLPFV